MNYVLQVFDADYAQVVLNRLVGGEAAQKFDLSDLADKNLPAPYRRLLEIPGAVSVIVFRNIIGIERCDPDYSWTKIAHLAATRASDFFDDHSLVHRDSPENFRKLFPGMFLSQKLSV